MTIQGEGADGVDRFIIEAYVTDGEVWRVQGYGSVSFNAIYQGRPPEHRYAVLRWWDQPTYAWKYGAFDMFLVKRSPDGTIYTPPRPLLVHKDLEAAIMATVLLYGE